MTGLPMVRIAAIVCLSTLTTFSDLHGQERYKDLIEEFYPREAEYTEPKPEYPQGVHVDAHEGDSLALVAFYNSTGGPSTWTDRTGWLQAPVSDWHGISLDSSGRVIVIELNKNKLSGTLPMELKGLEELQALDLGDNKLTGNIPPELGLLTSLQTLDLPSNQLSGWIPIELARLSELRRLNLLDNRLTGEILPELGQLANLTELVLGSNNFAGRLPRELTQLTKLEQLVIGSYDLTGGVPPWLAELGELRILWLYGSNLSGTIPPELGRLTHLETLILHGVDLEGSIPPELGLLTRLRLLRLSSSGFTGVIPPELGQLAELRELKLIGHKLSGEIPPELGQLAELREFELYGNNLSGEIPPELGQLAELRKLSLSGLNLSGEIPPEMGDLKMLETLILWRTGISGPIPPELGQLAELRTLRLEENYSLSGPIPPELGQLAELRYLSLEDNYSLSGPIPPELGQLSRLQRLSITSTGLSGPIPPELGRLNGLWRLSLSSNNLSGSIPPELGQLQSLSHLVLHQNSFSGPIPPGFGRLEVLSLNNNNFSGPMPDLTQLGRLSQVSVQTNHFLFVDLLPNAALSRLHEFSYNPQERPETLLACDAGYVFTTADTAEGNQYQWYRNGQPIPGAQSDTLRLTTASDLDEFHATITNEALPDLTLISHRVSTDGADPCTTQQYANAADSTLLVDFFNRTHGSLLWHTHTGWLEEPVAEWFGITLDASGRVTHVNLPNNNLVGQLPLSQLDQLPHLRYLDVSGNEFSGTIPKGLGALTQLEYLDLSRNTLAGELPKELAGQAPLKMLNVTGNQLVGTIPTELSQIATLQTFSVSTNQLSGPVPAFTGLDQLDTLHLAQNAFLFMDLLPNASLTRLDDFVYAPQDFIETLLTSTASGFALTTAAKAVGNRYQWYRDDQPISGPQSDTLQVSATSDPAQYHATITNDRLPDLTLVSRKKGVHDGLTLTEADMPNDFLLHQSYPNPFAEATTVAFELGAPEHVRIVVYDLLGKAVATIADGRFTAGVHRVEFTGNHLASGQYMYRMEAGAYRATRFMSVVR